MQFVRKITCRSSKQLLEMYILTSLYNSFKFILFKILLSFPRGEQRATNATEASGKQKRDSQYIY